MGPPPAPRPWGGCYARPAGGDGAPLPVYRGAVWPGWATQGVPGGGGSPGMAPPPRSPLEAAVPRAPLGGIHPGGPRSDAAGGDGASLRV